MKDNNPETRGVNRNEKGQFVEGVSGHPEGRPKGAGISITTEIKRKLEEVPKGQKATYLELLINRIFKQAIQDGDQQMIKNIWNYVDGMPKQKIETDVTFDETEKVDKLADIINEHSKRK